jgi:cardiolipin synthase A/B
VLDPELDKLRGAILAAFAESRAIDRTHYEARPRGEQLLNWFAYQGYRALMKLLTVGGYD